MVGGQGCCGNQSLADRVGRTIERTTRTRTWGTTTKNVEKLGLKVSQTL